MTDLLRYQRQVAWVCLLLGVAGAAGLYLGYPDRWEYGAGLLLGVVAGVIRMRIMAVAILQVMAAMEAGNTTRSLFRHQMIGYVILGGALFGGFHLGGSGMGWATLGGLLLPNVVLGLDGYLRPVQAEATDAASQAQKAEPESGVSAESSMEPVATGAESDPAAEE